MPVNYGPDPRRNVYQQRPDGTYADLNGRVVSESSVPGHTVWDKVAHAAPYGIMAGMAYGGAANAFGLPGATSAASHAASGATATAATGSRAGMTAQQMYDAGMFAGPAATAGANMAGTLGSSAATTAAVTQALTQAGVSHSTIQHLLSDPSTYAGLAALLPSIMGGFGTGNSPFGGGDTAGLMDEARKSLELQRHRVEQAQPVYDTLVNMAYGSSPMTSRGSAPAGYTPNAAPQGAYAYQGPRFGRNG